MDYLFCFIIWFFGVAFHIMLKIQGLRAQFPNLAFKMIWTTFFNQEWDSLIVSGLIISVYELALFICSYNGVVYPSWFDMWGMYVLAIVLGYGGQSIAYKYLNTAVDELEKRADQIRTFGKLNSVKPAAPNDAELNNNQNV